VEQLGSGKRPAVSVTLRGHTYRSTIAPMGGVYTIPPDFVAALDAEPQAKSFFETLSYSNKQASCYQSNSTGRLKRARPQWLNQEIG
jgi:bacteriocin resistance YdeI/OmpD-like protein